MATLNNRHDVQFLSFPKNYDTTAWRPYGLPVILVVPHRRDSLGNGLPCSDVWGVRVYVEDVPHKSLVAGPDHVGLLFPDHEIYAQDIPLSTLSDRWLRPETLDYLRNGQLIDAEDRRSGDLILYRCAAGILDTIPYLPDADYYDISDITLEVELLPVGKYNIVYFAKYYTRQLTLDGSEFLCINIDKKAIALLRAQFNHPGDILNEFYKLTPVPYLTNASKAADTTVAIYRPFTDVLQDVASEQLLLQRLNWVLSVPYQSIPYLSALLGWDLPFYPNSPDNLRRAILRRTAYFQTIKGSKQVVLEFFKLLGLQVLINNLWWSSDGKSLIGVNTKAAPTTGEAITVHKAIQIEPVLADYRVSGFGQLAIPLLYRPQTTSGLDNFRCSYDSGDVTLDAYLVELKGSETEPTAYTKLLDIVGEMVEDPDGFYSNYGAVIQSELDGLDIGSYSRIVISDDGVTESHRNGWGTPPLSAAGTAFDRDSNQLTINFDSYINFQGGDDLPPKRRASALFVFATYIRQVIVVPPALEFLQSNRFDLQFLTINYTPPLIGQPNYVEQSILEFIVGFIYKIKAFHSLLNAVFYTIELTETYEVTNLCVGGRITQQFDTDLGKLQVPPAIIPIRPSDDCDDDPINLGYKPTDIILRLRKLANLPEEFEAYKALDNRDDTYDVTGPRIMPALPAEGRTECKFTHTGQDRIISVNVDLHQIEVGPSPNATQNSAGLPSLCPTRIVDRGQFDHGASTSSNSDSSSYGASLLETSGTADVLCELDGNTNYCYKGRVGNDLLYRLTPTYSEHYSSTIGNISLGRGIYWTYPTIPRPQTPGTMNPAFNSHTTEIILTGLALQSYYPGYLESQQHSYLSVNPRQQLPSQNNSKLGRLFRNYDEPYPESLHYSDRPIFTNAHQSHFLALQRPELDIDQPIMHFPGCRFITMNRILDDVVTPWKAKPWDDQYSSACGDKYWCGQSPSWLHAQLLQLNNREQVLIYDDVPLIYNGSGLQPDILSLSDHTISDNNNFAVQDVVHTIISTQPASHPAITLNAVEVQLDTTLNTLYPVFNSAINYDTGEPPGTFTWMFNNDMLNSHFFNTGSTTFIDFSDGYPAMVGIVGSPSTFADRNGFGFLPPPCPIIFLLGDGIKHHGGIRLDLGCLIADHGTTADNAVLLCSIDQHRDSAGQLDWNPDQLTASLIGNIPEQIGVGSLQLDGTIPTLFELIIGK